MARLPLVCAGILSLFVSDFAGAATPECIAGPDNSITVSDCLSQLLNRADVELNETYQRVLGMLSDGATQRTDLSATRVRFVRSQRAWIAFRDQDCLAVGSALPRDPAL